jgi:hypothetical protein
MFSSAFVVLGLSASAFANIYITQPVGSTTWTGGQQSTVSWQDDGQQPSLASFGPAMVSIYAGNSQQQTLLQTITPSVDVSTTQTIVFTPDPSIGPSTDEYFIRFQSLSLKDANNTQYPALAFSAKFTMAGMSGTFNATVQAQIDGQSTAPIGGTASPAATGAAGASATSTGASGMTTSKVTAAGAAQTSSASGSSSSSTSGAAPRAVGGIVAVGAIAVAMFSALC